MNPPARFEPSKLSVKHYSVQIRAAQTPLPALAVWTIQKIIQLPAHPIPNKIPSKLWPVQQLTSSSRNLIRYKVLQQPIRWRQNCNYYKTVETNWAVVIILQFSKVNTILALLTILDSLRVTVTPPWCFLCQVLSITEIIFIDELWITPITVPIIVEITKWKWPKVNQPWNTQRIAKHSGKLKLFLIFNA